MCSVRLISSCEIMDIRVATSADSFSLAELRWEFRSESVVSSERSNFIEKCSTWFENSMSSDHWFATVAESNSALVGCMCLQCVEKVPSPEQHVRHWGYVTNSYVSPTHRNKGVGGKLLKAIVNLGRERKLELLIVWPSVEAVSLYENAGFRIASEMHQESEDHPPMELVY